MQKVRSPSMADGTPLMKFSFHLSAQSLAVTSIIETAAGTLF